MNSVEKITVLAILMMTAFAAAGSASRCPNQVALTREADLTVTTSDLRSDIEFLCSDLCEGRSTTQRGGVEAGFWIVRRFRSLGLVPFGDGYVQSFSAGEHTGHNIVGMIPASRPRGSDRYVFILAHYDNIGRLGGTLYPGADSNASGVAAMLAMAQMFRYVATHGGDTACNIVFAALDAKQLSLAGSRNLWHRISTGAIRDPYRGCPVRKDEIAMVVNLDILGSSASPLSGGRPDYLIMLGADKVQRGLLHRINIQYCTDLDLAYDYYDSKGFTDLFLKRVSDQKFFLENNVPAVMFTSGITMNTNRSTDDISEINVPVLHRRTRLVFHWLERYADAVTGQQ